VSVFANKFHDWRIALSGSIFHLLVSPQYTLPQEKPMSAEAARRAPLMPLPELVRLYRSLTGEFGQPVALSAFGLTKVETERLFSGYDEDYHISRFFQFSEAGGEKFSINGVPATHVSLDAEIESIL
jgi:hypothetical protein